MVKKKTNKIRLRVTEEEYAAYIGIDASGAEENTISSYTQLGFSPGWISNFQL